MPAMYAHQRFGEIVCDQLPRAVRERIAPYREVFDIGLQGPDIFFYHSPITWGEFPQYGNRLHEMTGHEFFRSALILYGRYFGWRPASQKGSSGNVNRSDRGVPAMATRVYLYGVVCHYALDSMCHPCINRIDAGGHATHAQVEGDFDRYLLVKEGKNPVKEDISRGIHPSSASAEAIEIVYPKANAGVVLRSLRLCVAFQRLLICKSDAKRNFICGALRKLGKYESLAPHIMSKEPDPDCREANLELDQLFEEAIPMAVRMIVRMDEDLEEGCPPNVDSSDYDRNFDGKNV